MSTKSLKLFEAFFVTGFSQLLRAEKQENIVFSCRLKPV